MFQTISIPELHQEYHSWIAELSFCKEEITNFEHHLEEIVCKNRNIEITAQLEHFQNQFILQKEVTDRLKHDLNIAEKQLAAFARELSDTGLDNIKMDNHSRLREEVQMFRKIYNELKKEFRGFESNCGTGQPQLIAD